MEKEMSLKLLVEKQSQKVLFAETGKDFVDFLSNLLQLPLGYVIRLLGKRSMVGCVGTLYQSVENLDFIYFQSGRHKKVVLSTSSHVLDGNSTPRSLQYHCDNASRGYNQFYQCYKYVTHVRGTTCPQCKNQMATEMTCIGDEEKKGCDAGEGYVKGVVTYMLMDDLAIAPMSAISSIILLNKFNIKDVGFVEELVVKVGMEEGLAILEQSFKSKAVLTDVFLRKKAA